MALLGIKMSVCCTLLSAWAIIMLAVMGGLLTIKSVAFVEDFEAGDVKPEDVLKVIDSKYDAAAYNCWIATGLYGITLLFSAHQWYLNSQ